MNRTETPSGHVSPGEERSANVSRLHERTDFLKVTTMTTATMEPMTADKAHRQTRAALQQQLTDRDKIKAELDAALVRMNSAKRAVETFEKPAGFADQPERDWSHKARAFNNLNNAIPQELTNSCQDPELRSQFDDAMGVKRVAIREQQSARDADRDATQALDTMRSRLTRGHDGSTAFGEPAVLREGDAPPWPVSVVVRAGLRVASAVGLIPSDGEPVLWVIRGDVLEFRPGTFVGTDIERDFVRGWADKSREVRRAGLALQAADARLKSASDALEVVRQKLIWSAV